MSNFSPKEHHMTTKPCRKCGGTGFLPALARVDHGRCWACLPAASAPTPEQIADDEAFRQEQGIGLSNEERSALRRERRAARRAVAS